jgi:hypothetical protein
MFVRSRSDGGGAEHACLAEERKSDGHGCIVRMQLLPVIGSDRRRDPGLWRRTLGASPDRRRPSDRGLKGRSRRLPPAAETSVAVTAGARGP